MSFIFKELIEMKKITFASLLLFLTFAGCGSDKIFNYEKDTPEWLKTKIDSVTTSNPKYYSGTKVFRYEWNKQYVYHFSIPLSSCVYCELYDQEGRKIQFTDNAMTSDFEQNKINKVLVWDWFSYYK
jgi:hypothetical protein